MPAKRKPATTKKRLSVSGASQNKASRRILVWLLIALAATLLAVGNVFFWAGNTVVNQDRFVKATAPIIKDDQVQQTLALYGTNKLFENVDVQKVTEGVLPPRADFLAPQLSDQLRKVTEGVLQKTLDRPEFQDRFNAVMARQHQRLINLATNYEGDGTLSVNDFYTKLTDSLKDTRLAFLADKKLPADVGNVTIVTADRLPTFHRVVTNIDLWRNLALGAVVLFAALAIWLSRNRRRTAIQFSGLVVILMLVSLIAVRIVRELVTSKADPQYADGLRRVLEIFTNPLMIQTLTILLAALVLGLGVWLSGNGRRAKAVKQRTSLLFAGKFHDSLFGKRQPEWTKWIQSHKRNLQISLVAVLTVVLLMASLTISSLLIYVLVLVVLILLVEFIGGQPPSTKRRK